MTIYGTPGGTPLNTTPFQGTAPGNAAQATMQPVNPGVGLFPPNSNNLSGDSVAASQSRAAIPANTYITNEGVGNNITINSALGTGSDGGNQASATNGVPYGSAAGGGQAGVGGQGGANFNDKTGAVGDVQLGAQANPGNLTFQGGGSQPVQFAG
jgi:hypothetical protein